MKRWTRFALVATLAGGVAAPLALPSTARAEQPAARERTVVIGVPDMH